MIDPHSYNITIRRDSFDGDVCFQARVKELPDLTEYADTYDEAYQLVIDSIVTSAEAFAERGMNLPQPQAIAEEYSGRITLRLPKSLHRAMVEASDEEGISLNQYVVNVLSYFSGYASGWRQGHDHDPWKSIFPAAKQSRSRIPNIKLVHSSDLQASNGWENTG